MGLGEVCAVCILYPFTHPPPALKGGDTAHRIKGRLLDRSKPYTQLHKMNILYNSGDCIACGGRGFSPEPTPNYKLREPVLKSVYGFTPYKIIRVFVQ